MSEKSSCKKCGACCANFLLLSNEEILQIKQYIINNNIKPVNRNSPLIMDGTYDNCCPFLTKENLCAIYSVRPSICKEFECSAFCDTTQSNQMDYRNIKAINMMKTFYPNEFCPFDDKILNELNKKLIQLKKKIYKGE